MLSAVEEAQARQQEGTGKGGEEKQSWAESLITAIVKNLEV